MSYTMTLELKSTYLHAVITGRNSRENVEGYFRELLAECQARDCFRVLIEERLEGPRLPLIDVFEIAVMGSSMMLGIAKAIAYVDVYADIGKIQFAEDVAVNRGLPIKIFTSVAEAEQWLLGKS